MSTKRRKTQMELAFKKERRGDAPESAEGGIEVRVAKRESENPADTEHLMEEVCKQSNARRALKRVRQNKGSPGVDGVTVDELPGCLRENWPRMKEELLAGKYKTQPVKRVEIPKPGGGVRKLGVPTVQDRFVQQAVMQILQPLFDPTFSEHSYGFRPGRSAHQAVAAAQRYVVEGYNWVVDIDLEKFFDRVNHDKLLARLAGRIADKRMLKLIRAFLNAGVMENGLVGTTLEGTPQGGPLSPLLSNIVLDDLDRELEKRGHKFARYADDCNIYVRSERAGQRVMQSISRFIERKLKLNVNRGKSAVAKPKDRKFLGFRIVGRGANVKRGIAPQSLKRFKHRVRQITRRTRGVTLGKMVEQLSRYLLGWRGYFGHCQTPSILTALDSWIRRRLRSVCWKQWKRGKVRFKELRKRGVGIALAVQTAGSARGPWRISLSPALSFALPNAYFASLGLPSLLVS